jgi:acetate---CoA ligase (ADP-forming)
VTDSLFAPRGIAVVGASPKPSNIGRQVLGALRRHRFGGDLAAVNPGFDDIEGTPCHPSLHDVPFPVDLVLVFVAANRTLATVEQAADSGAGAVVVYSSGFAETGEAGGDAQQLLRQVAHDRNIRVLGPNCQGLVDFRSGLAATFTPAVLNADVDKLAPIAYVGQSGALGGVFFDQARQRGATPTAWVSTGNEVDVTVCDAALQLIEAGPLELLCLYLERVPDGADWVQLAGRARDDGTRIAVLRSGRSDSGRRAAASHTGALVADDRPFELACDRYGVSRVTDLADLVDLAVATRAGHTTRGTGVAVVTTSGGAGGLAADRVEACGLSVPVLCEQTQRRLREVLPAFGSAVNPVDVTADLMTRAPEDLDVVCRIVADDPGVDQILLAVTNLVGDMAAKVAASLDPGREVPLTMAYLAAPDRIAEHVESLSQRAIGVHASIESAVRSMAAMTKTAARGGPADRSVSPESGPELPQGDVLTEWAATPLLDWVEVHRPDSVLVTDPDGLPAAVAGLGGRAVLKVQSPQVMHKSELGAVVVGVDTAQAAGVGRQMLAAVAAAIPDVAVEGILVQRISEPGVELLVGIRAPANGYPATITVGLGGTFVELYGDVATSFAPLDTADARALIGSLRGFPLLDGYRGRQPCDVDAAALAVARLSRVAAVSALREVEVNPLIVHAAGRGVTAVDLLVRKEMP